MTARRGTNRAPIAAIGRIGVHGAILLAALLALTLALASRAEAYIYWTHSAGYIERANLDGSPSVAPRASGDNAFIFVKQTTFVPGEPSLAGVEVDGAHIYWANPPWAAGKTIGRANLDATGVNNSFITGASGPDDVAPDGEHIYWSNAQGNSLGRANLDGTGADQSFVSLAEWGGSEVTSSAGVAVDDAHIYWANSGSYGRTIGRANLDGTEVDPNFIRAAHNPRGVAADGEHLYWTSQDRNTADGVAEGGIGRANLNGTDVDPNFIAGVTSPQAVAVDGGHIYWTNFDPPEASSIGRASLDGTDVDQSFIPVTDAQGIAVDALRSFSFGKVKRNTKKGTAKLGIQVPGPGEVVLAETDRVKPNRTQAEAAGKVKLSIKPRGEAKKRLKRKGKAKVEAEVTYAPTGDDPNVVANTNATMVKLVKRR